MRKVLAVILVMVLGTTALVGCSGKGGEGKNGADNVPGNADGGQTVEDEAREEADGAEKETPAAEIDESHKLKVGVLAAMTALPVVDISNNGTDKENGIEIELIPFSTGAPMNEAMAAGELDVSFIGAAAVFSLANNDSKMIGEICTDTVAIDLIVRGDSDIAGVKGENPDYPEILGNADTVKGKTILCPAGTLSQFEVSKYLNVFDLTMDDVTFVPMEYAQAYQAFKTGEGDILATRSPQTYTAIDDEGWVSAASMKDLKADATAQIVVSAEAYENKADALSVLLSLVAKEGDKLNGDVEYAASLMSEWFRQNGQDIDLEVSKRQLSEKPFYGVEDVKTREFGADFKNTLVEFYVESEQLEAELKDTVCNNVRNDILVKAGLNE